MIKEVETARTDKENAELNAIEAPQTLARSRPVVGSWVTINCSFVDVENVSLIKDDNCLMRCEML